MANILRRHFMLHCMALFVASAVRARPAHAAGIANLNDAINKAGSLRMLSQRMAKAYCQIGQNVWTDNSRRILASSIDLYQTRLNELKAFAPSADIKATYVDLDANWQRYHRLLVTAPSLADGQRVAELSEDSLRIAHLATTQLELSSPTSVGRLINIAGRQRMLSQRLAKLYMCRQWGISNPATDTEMGLAKREFLSAMDALAHAPESTGKIGDELSLARHQWMFFDNSLMQQSVGNKDSYDAVNVATTSERILEIMDHVTGLYAQLPAPTAAAAVRAVRR